MNNLESTTLKLTGLSVIHDFISLEQEKEIMDCIVKQPPKKTGVRNSIQRFGIGQSYKDNLVSKEIPEFLNKLALSLVDQKLLTTKPNLISINEYYAGQQIPAHKDSRESGEVITTLSLLGSATMIFQKGKTTIPIELPPRCLVQMRDDARNSWLHSILPVKETRYSIVFRY